jgi:hypothetical protein
MPGFTHRQARTKNIYAFNAADLIFAVLKVRIVEDL